MTIEAYFDESGIHGDDAEVVAVCGFHGEQSAWRVFEKRWRLILRKEGLEQHGFHSKEFWGKKDGRRFGPYKTWSDRRAGKFLEKLIFAIESSRIYPVGHAVHIKEWFQESLEVRRWLTGGRTKGQKFIYSGAPKRPYYLPFQLCVVETLEQYSEPVHFAFGLDGHYSKHALAIYRMLQAEPDYEKRKMMGQCSFPFSRDTPGLQAADMLSYLLFRWWTSSLYGRKPVWAAATGARLIRRKRTDQAFVLFRKHQFAEIVEKNKAKQLAREKSRIQHRALLHLGSSEDTSQQGMEKPTRTVFRYGRYTAHSRTISLPSDRVREGRPVFDPRPLISKVRPSRLSSFWQAISRLVRRLKIRREYGKYKGEKGWNPAMRKVLRHAEENLESPARRYSKRIGERKNGKKAEEV